MSQGDYDGIKAVLRTYCDEDESGCWVWRATLAEGSYPQVGFSRPIAPGKRKTFLAHRLMLEAKLRRPIDGMQTHHICANTRCINPDHLELSTARQNVGEMMARKTYEARISELEAALAEYEPNHPLLSGYTGPES